MGETLTHTQLHQPPPTSAAGSPPSTQIPPGSPAPGPARPGETRHTGLVAANVRTSIRVEGVVQGVGFRPFVYSLATRLGLAGWVGNDVDGVFAEVEGPAEQIRDFLAALERDAPPLARVERVSAQPMTPDGRAGFAIVASDRPAAAAPWSPPTAPPARTACASWPTRPTGGSATRSSTARTAGPGSPSSATCPTTGR